MHQQCYLLPLLRPSGPLQYNIVALRARRRLDLEQRHSGFLPPAVRADGQDVRNPSQALPRLYL